jgi:Tol biopolymer transport system component
MDVYVLDWQTGELSRLTTNETRDRMSVWLSNDELLFRSFRNKIGERFYVMNRDGTNVHPLPWDITKVNSVDWSNDYRWFAWEANDTKEILVGDLKTEQIKYTGVRGGDPKWSSSGLWIAFTTSCRAFTEACFAQTTGDIWVMNREGLCVLNLTSDIAGRKYQPVWLQQ